MNAYNDKDDYNNDDDEDDGDKKTAMRVVEHRIALRCHQRNDPHCDANAFVCSATTCLHSQSTSLRNARMN